MTRASPATATGRKRRSPGASKGRSSRTPAAAPSPSPAPGAIGYLAESERPGTSLIFLAPLILLYELYAVGIIAGTGGGQPAGSHITAFLLIEQLFHTLGAAGRHLPAIALVGMLLSAHIARGDRWGFHPGTLFAMGVEAIAWALPLLMLGWMLSRFLPDLGIVDSLLGTDGAGRWAVLCLGAGVYEEMVFRLIGVTLLLAIVCELIGVPRKTGVILVLLGTGVLFAMYHYLSPAEDFRLRTCVFRTAAGVYFGGLFLARGFGVTAAAHAAYDLIVVGLLAH